MLNKISLGTVQFGLNYGIANKQGKIKERDVYQILDFAYKKGIKILDTGDAYGKSEVVIGHYSSGSNNDFKIVSKLSGLEEYSSKEAEDKFLATLKRLKKDKIYGYLVHRFEDLSRNKELWDFFKRLKKEGRVKKIGFSLYHPEELKTLLDKKIDFDIVQIPYSVFDQRFKVYASALKNRGVEVYARSVFLQGLFFLNIREIKKHFPSAVGSMERLNKISTDYNVPVHSLCLCFVLLNDFIDKVIIGIDSLEQLKQNIDALKYLSVVRKNFNTIERDLRLDNEEVILPFNWRKATAIIQARMGSSRLPGKVLLKVMDKTILEYVVERVRKARNVGDLIIATTTKKDDLKIVNLAKKLGIKVFCGSEADVLERYYQAATLFKAKHIIRITSDCPLIDPGIIDNVIDSYFESEADYCTNSLSQTFPDGVDVELFSYGALKDAWENAKLLSEREHVTPYIKNNPDKFKIVSLKNSINLQDKRWTLDREEDFIFIRCILNKLYPKNPDFGMNDIIEFLKKNPYLENINEGIIRNEGYLKSLSNDKCLNSK